MTSRGEEFRNASSVEPCFGQPEGCPKTRATSSDNNGIVFMVLTSNIRGIHSYSSYYLQHTMTGYFWETKGEASFARSGWFATIRANQLIR
jgi:hypothetical protein